MIIDTDKDCLEIYSTKENDIPFYERNYIKQVIYCLKSKENSKLDLF